MELIKEALLKAKASAKRAEDTSHFDRPGVASPDGPPRPTSPPLAPAWSPPLVQLNGAHLEGQRIVSFAQNDPSHIAFNMLRTKVYKALKENAATSLALTSPSAGSGKTMVAINLAFSLARQPDCKTVLIDLDLRKSAVARTLGIDAKGSISQYLEGKDDFRDCFVQVGEKLIFGLNSHPVKYSSEMMQDQRLRDLIARVREFLNPDVLIFDLPPMLSGDDTIGFLPSVDACLLVIASGETTAQQVEECERHINPGTRFLGIVLNKSAEHSQEYYSYGA